MKFLQQIKELREALPIGLKEAKLLLEENDGNIALASKKFKSDLTNRLIEESGIDKERAKQFLVESNFDINAAKEKVYECQYSETERILKRNATNEQKITHIYRAILNKQNFEADYYKNEDCLNQFNKSQKLLLIVIECLEYEDYEGFTYLVYFELYDEFIELIEIDLNLAQLARDLKEAKAIKSEIEEIFHPIEDNLRAFRDNYHNDKRLLCISELLEDTKDEIYDQLILYVERTITDYP